MGAAVTVVVLLGSSLAAGAAEPESQRFGSEEFYDGLIELKLFDLLECQLRLDPPDEELTRLLVIRKARLAVADDEHIDATRRRVARAEANRILSEIIAAHAGDPRAIQWQLTLAGSLIYEEAEPCYSGILYRGGTADDRRQLAALMDRATANLTSLMAFLEAEYARIDELSIAEYERLDDQGYVTDIEEALPKAEYMLRWAKFHSALALEPQSAARRRLLEEILRDFDQQPDLLNTAHSITHVQAQSLLLAGMTCRRLANHESAIRFLQDATAVVEGIPNAQERRDLQWLITLASVERIRALCDDGRFGDADVALHALRRTIDQTRSANFGHALMLALLESSVEQARATQSHPQDAAAATGALADSAVAPLAALAARDPAAHDEVYATLYEQLRSAPDPARLHPFQQCAVIAGHIAEATRLRHSAGDVAGRANNTSQEDLDAEAVELLEAAAKLAHGLIERRERIDASMYCEVRHNLSVADFHLGRRAEAVAGFIDVANGCPGFARAQSAASYAVEIAAQLAEDPTLRSRKDVQDLQVRALSTLDEGFADSDAAEYWRFFLAQALEDTGNIEGAARCYDRVDERHPHFLSARLRAARCRFQMLQDLAMSRSGDVGEIRRQASEVRLAIDQFQNRAGADRVEAGTDDVARLVAESFVLLAELNILPGVDRPGDTINLLDGFEVRYAEHRDLVGRVLKARIIAFEATGRLDEARQTVPRYLASAAADAGATLQSLFHNIRAEIEQYRRLGQADKAAKKAEAATMFAEQLFFWATSSDGTVSADGLYLLRLQLAEAMLDAGRAAEAQNLFEQCVAEDAKRHDDQTAHDPRAVAGLAEALFQLGRFGEALPLFNRIFQESPQAAPRRFSALLGDLRCRTELGEDPAGIVDVIRQHRFLSPDMGGAHLKDQFADLQNRNEKRLLHAASGRR